MFLKQIKEKIPAKADAMQKAFDTRPPRPAPVARARARAAEGQGRRGSRELTHASRRDECLIGPAPSWVNQGTLSFALTLSYRS